MQNDKKVKSSAMTMLLDRLCTTEETKELLEAKLLRSHMVREFHKDCHDLCRQDIFCGVIRKIYNLSQEAFADCLGLSTEFIADIEKGRYPKDEDALYRFEEAAAGFFLLRNSQYMYDCDDHRFDEESEDFIEDVRHLWSSLNLEREKIYEDEFKMLPELLQEEIKKSGKKFIG